MFNKLKVFLFLFLLIFSSNVNAKPIPPGAGDGDVAANILFLVDSSASMGSWIGKDGLGQSFGVSYDAEGRILVGQNVRRSLGGVLRYTAAGERDTTFRITGIPTTGCFQHVDATRNIQRQSTKRTSTIKFVEGLSTNMLNNENIVFYNSLERRTSNYVFGFNEDGTECRFALANPGNVYDFDIKTINGTPYIFTTGPRSRRSGFFKSCNLTTMTCREQIFNDRNHITLRHFRHSVNNDGSIMYFSDSNNGDLVGRSLVSNGGAFDLGGEVRRCNAVNNPNLQTQMMFATGIEVSPESSDVVYIGSHIRHALQKIQWTGNNCAVVTSVGLGTASNSKNIGSPNELDADSVNFNGVVGFNVTNSRIVVATRRGFIDVFDEDRFTSASRDTSWLQQMGGPRIRRWDGVKQAINAIVNDTTLTTGAYFGFGHWNAGEEPGRRAARGGQFCHRNDGCSYYGSWQGDHPNGSSSICYSDSCLNVAVSPRGAGRIMDVLNPLGLAWGTDANAFSQIAEDYFNDGNAGGQILDPDSDCQLNYVIVIGDGAMNHTGVLGQNGDSADRIARLREKGVKSIYVAYGGGITGTNLQRFHELARIGSSTATNATECAADDECERAIEAATPEELKTELTSRIRQIIADKLAFTAPSITATIQEGGALYQAQFAYEQYGEWRGTLLRKKLKSADCDEDCVEHNTDPGNTHGNWSAATMMKGDSKAGDEEDTRKIWTAMPGAAYLGNWDNFNVDNSDTIRSLFETVGYTVPDYHNATSHCSDVGSDPVLGDETTGLINFMKGNDYFDYDGDCDVTEVRDWVMGDIYHSQLVEVGAPNANISFSNTNEEAYYRSINGYQNFMTAYANRQSIIYAGSNSGMLHAINASTGKEEWGFIPPFIGSLLPQIVNSGLDGDVDKRTDDDGNSLASGGTNPIFGVDGSPVVHDLFIRGYSQNGDLEGSKSWRTILFVPYGRGGAGFSAIDITYPIPVGGKGPIHMFSVFNDRINSRVLIADVDGRIDELEYNASSTSLLDSSEGEMATDNFNEARDADDTRNDGETTEIDAIAACVNSADFKDAGTNSCYKNTTFHFPNISLDYAEGTKIPDGILSATELINNVPTPIKILSAEMGSDDGAGLLKVTFEGIKTFNANQTQIDGVLQDPTNLINITACLGASGIDPEYDYTRLGETWSTPRIIRMPTSQDGRISTDRYVAVLGGGNAKNDQCGGSAIFLVDLEGHTEDKPGKIFGADINGGPITIVDTSPLGVSLGSEIEPTPNGSDIANAITANPVVITPDTAPNIPWRGALVYINDLEGKITKINLSNNTKGYTGSGLLESNVTKLYDQTTIFRLNASEDNGRYSYFGMDAGIGYSDGGFWLFGSTGNFTDLGSRETGLDNILYGVQDQHYPYWKHLNGVTIPSAVVNPGAEPIQINSDFIRLANQGANNADNHAGNALTCVNVSGDDEGENCPLPNDAPAWVIHLEKNSSGSFLSPRTFRKASASPTLFKGVVYYPVYQPPAGTNRCNQGHAFVCAADDECGTNSSSRLELATPGEVDNPGKNACAYVREGVLSELVVFADKLYANVAGPSDDESTLFSILSIPGDIISNKGGWRDSSF